MKCVHMEFHAKISTGRIFDRENEVDMPGLLPNSYCVDLVVACVQCGMKLQFLGLPRGLVKNGAAVSFDRTEARLEATIQKTSEDL